MKRIALALILVLARPSRKPTSSILWITIFFVQSIRWHSETSGRLVHQGKAVNATDFAPRYKWRWCYYFKANEQVIRAAGLCGLHANGAAPAGLLLRSRQWCIYAGRKRGHCTASKELFDARYGNTHRTGPARFAYALSAQRRAWFLFNTFERRSRERRSFVTHYA